MNDQQLKNSGQGIAYKALRVHKLVDDRPYKWGGKSPDGFDCSGYVAYVFGNLFPEKKIVFQTDVNGFIESELFETVEIPMLGDLIIFPRSGGFVNHIGIVVDQKRWIGSQSSTGVEFVNFSNGFWSKRKYYFRRLKTFSMQSLSSYIKHVGGIYV